ncbi:MAG: nitroreductase [Desulfobacterales bacterium]|nr:nitroreductase [Desulfobacterales bacterium]
MEQFVEILKDRRSIRKYKTDEIPEEKLNELLEAVQCTQSWHNNQCWELVLIQDQSVKEKIQKTVPSINPGFKAIVTAPIIIALCGKVGVSGKIGKDFGSKFGKDWFMYDLGLATQNLCNQAHATGLGTVVVGWFDHEKAGEVINLPEGYELVTLIPVGFPDHKGTSPERKSIEEFTHHNSF